ncbi:hypothetical protein BOX15_Mlig015813g2, partial [Macrostomum lignano]
SRQTTIAIMKVEIFDIVFDDAEVNPQAVYRSGQTIAFQVHLRLTEPVKCRAIYVKLFGHSYVHWTESRSTGSGNNRRTETVHYRSEEVYIDQKVAIYTPETAGPSAEHHPAGEYIYPVTFQLPPTAPSSFEGGIGRIRYEIKANIDRPWKFDNYTKKMFTVIRDFDLNIRLPDEVGPFKSEEDFDVKCCYCFNCCCGKVRVSVALPKKGYVPGEQVHITGEICNTSKTNLENVNLEIYQQSIFITPSKRKTSSRVASSVSLSGIEQGQSMQLNHLLPVNPVPSSHIEGCNNIRVHYYFRDGGCCLSMKKECCELLIGSVPLWSTFGMSPLPPPLPTAPSGDGVVEQQPQPGGQFVPPPPSYAECMFGRVEMDKDEGRSFNASSQWAPSYPYFPLAATAPPAATQASRWKTGAPVA